MTNPLHQNHRPSIEKAATFSNCNINSGFGLLYEVYSHSLATSLVQT